MIGKKKMGSTEEIIKELKSSNLYAQCPCGGEFKLSDTILFDGTKPFPKEALEKQKKLQEQIKEREGELKKRKNLATTKAEITAKSVNLGKKAEVVLPTMRGFKWELPDCRFLGDPIDMITFNGLSVNKVNSINFIEIKSGAAKLNNHQKLVKDAVEDKKVSYNVIK